MSEARRSTRIAAQPKKEEPTTKVTKPARKASSKKREAGDDKAGKDVVEVQLLRRYVIHIVNLGYLHSKAESDEQVSESVGDAKVAEPANKGENLKAIDLGDTLPSLTLKNEKGEDVEVANLAAEKGLIFFLVPKADTPGCTNQACGFRDIYPDFTSLGYDVYCLSADSPTAQTKWQTKKELPYALLSDPERVLITALGAGEGGKTKRSHFIFEKGGKLVEKQNPVKPADSPKLALEFVKSHTSA
ncbi:hypothetical protein EW026_g6590 [Hermanssonia centrifuga]|uniref:thioredoxin-dependent peroxiredoxin n=1 Tax=Hermanssonia centrifuga TaxID=98765 RepID=A0A4S4KAK6_9APHY|nr:hypothetical protein EW026_g6590 [Hermanssonia centrifuga]